MIIAIGADKIPQKNISFVSHSLGSIICLRSFFEKGSSSMVLALGVNNLNIFNNGYNEILTGDTVFLMQSRRSNDPETLRQKGP